MTAALLVVSTLAAGLTSLVSNVPGVLPIGPVLGQIVGWGVAIVSVFVLFTLIYRVLPNAAQTWRSVISGTLLSMVLVILISQAFPIYVRLFPPNHAYAVFGVFLLLTFWLYILGIVLVLGAELNAFLEQPTRSVALAEATAAAQRGQATMTDTGAVKAEATGQAPAMRGGRPFGAPSRSPSEQVAAEQDHDGRDTGSNPVAVEPRRRVGLAGRLIGFAGLVVAALLLRGGVPGRRKTRAPKHDQHGLRMQVPHPTLVIHSAVDYGGGGSVMPRTYIRSAIES